MVTFFNFSTCSPVRNIAEPAERTEQQRQLIEFRLQGLSFAEIARRLNLAEQAVRELEAELLARVPPSE